MKQTCLILFLLFALFPLFGFAQKPPAQESYGIFSTRAEYDQFMGSVKQAAANDPELRGMIGLINDIVLNQPIGATDKKYGGPASNLGILADPNVRREIEMVDDQYKELQDLNSDIQKRMAEQMRNLDFSETANIVSQIRRLRAEAEEDLEGVLLPHQLQRLRQIKSQSDLRFRSLAELLTSDPLKTELKISDDQSAGILESEKEIEEQLARDITKLQEAARKKLISNLKRSQQERVEEIFGESFDSALSADPGKANPKKSRQ